VRVAHTRAVLRSRSDHFNTQNLDRVAITATFVNLVRAANIFISFSSSSIVVILGADFL